MTAADTADAWRRLLAVRAEAHARAAGLRRGSDDRWRWTHATSVEAAQLADLYLPLCLAGPRHAFGQLGQSLDGAIATRTGDAGFVTGPDDRRHLHRLRALADAVVVGAGTVAADDPQLTVRDVPGTNPTRVVLDPQCRVPRDRRLFGDGEAPTLWLLGTETTAPSIPAAHVDQLRLAVGDDGRIEPRQVLDALADRGLGRVLVEGGGVTVSRFLRAGALQRLYLTIAPVLVGDGVRGIAFTGSPLMRDALRPPTRRFDLGDDVLFELDLSSRDRTGETPVVVHEKSWS